MKGVIIVDINIEVMANKTHNRMIEFSKSLLGVKKKKYNH